MGEGRPRPTPRKSSGLLRYDRRNVASPSKTIRATTASADYRITIGPGLLETLHPRLVKLSAGKPFRPFLITSPEIWKLWSEQVRVSFPEAQSPTVLFVPSGEKFKRLKTVESLSEQLAMAGADRDALLLAFGGGVVGDITGFLAAIYMRGVPFVQLPTTLLAQVDSSVGGKTGVNLAVGKNLIGSFHQPRAVFADVELLSTLPNDQLRSGMQEAVKTAIIRDVKFFTYIEQNKHLLLERKREALQRVVAEAVKIKAAIVAADEREGGLRMLLNFGHTLGHAIEAATGYKVLLHGEAVAWGSIAALHLSQARGVITSEQFARMANLIFAFGPLPRFKVEARRLIEASATDKKNRAGHRAFVLPTAIGAAEVVHDVTDAELQTAAEAMLGDMRAATRKAR